MFWKYSRESNYYKRYPWPVLKFANSKKCSDDGRVKKTNKQTWQWKILENDWFTCCLSSIAMRFKSSNHYKRCKIYTLNNMERSHNAYKLTTQTSRAVAKNFNKDKIKLEAPWVWAFIRVHDFLRSQDFKWPETLVSIFMRYFRVTQRQFPSKCTENTF